MDRVQMTTYTERCRSERGYTLLEMALALMIIGIMLAGFAQAYTIYLRKEQIRVTDDNLKQITLALQSYKQLNGAFPCPAPLTAGRNDATYGTTTNCTDETTLPPGTAPTVGGSGEAGVAIALSARTPALAKPRVRIGGVPFRSLKLDEKVAYDGYGSKYVYALTEDMTEKTTFNPLLGGISIVDPDGASLIDPPNSGIFTIFSPGRDRKGAYNKVGNLTVPCGTDVDSENCDFGTDAVFTAALESNGTGNQFDDRIIYFSELNDTMWARSTANSNNIGDLALANTGIGTGTATPAAKVEIKDSASATGPAGTLRASNSIRTQLICPPGTPVGDTTNCFEPRNIGGNAAAGAPGTPTGPGDGMECPTGEYMSGIMDGRPICETRATVRCPNPGELVTGINPDGTLECQIAPCGTQAQVLCGTTRTLPRSAIGASIILTAGSTGAYSETWVCNNVGGTATWEQDSVTGACTCDPEVNNYGGQECGEGFTGTFTWTFTRSCPDGTETWTNDWSSATCACVARPPYVYVQDCPNQNYAGSITYTWPWMCPEGDWDWGNATVVNTCHCSVPAVTTRPVADPGSCPDGYTGTVSQNETFDATQCDWIPDTATSNCVCDVGATESEQRDPACQPWEHVSSQATFTRTRVLNGATCELTDWTLTTPGVCSPNLYSWQIYSSPGGNPVNTRVGPMVGDSCTPAQYNAGTDQACSTNSGSQFQVHRCTCRPAY